MPFVQQHPKTASPGESWLGEAETDEGRQAEPIRNHPRRKILGSRFFLLRCYGILLCIAPEFIFFLFSDVSVSIFTDVARLKCGSSYRLKLLHSHTVNCVAVPYKARTAPHQSRRSAEPASPRGSHALPLHSLVILFFTDIDYFFLFFHLPSLRISKTVVK